MNQNPFVKCYEAYRHLHRYMITRLDASKQIKLHDRNATGRKVQMFFLFMLESFVTYLHQSKRIHHLHVC